MNFPLSRKQAQQNTWTYFSTEIDDIRQVISLAQKGDADALALIREGGYSEKIDRLIGVLSNTSQQLSQMKRFLASISG